MTGYLVGFHHQIWWYDPDHLLMINGDFMWFQCGHFTIHWLVVDLPSWKILVNGVGIIPYMKWKIKFMFQTTNPFQLFFWVHHQLQGYWRVNLWAFHFDHPYGSIIGSKNSPRYVGEHLLVGGKPTPLKNMSSSDWIIIPTIGENKTCSKPPTSWWTSLFLA